MDNKMKGIIGGVIGLAVLLILIFTLTGKSVPEKVAGNFIDAGNVWGVDYDSSLSDTNKIRSSIGVGIDWFTVVGPLSVSFSHPISSVDTDKTESFKFNLGTTF